MRPTLPLPVAAFLVVLAACGGDAREGAAPAAPRARHLVLVLVDQLRHDAVEASMPRVSALAREGVVLDGMRSVAPWTYPSVISLVSGLYPQQHGADGELFGNVLTTFSTDVPTLQRRLDGAGYATAAFVTNPFLHTWNPFHQGFDHFDASFINSQGNRRGYGEHVWTEDMFADNVDAALGAHFEARPVTDPEFTYVHYIDVHGPWDGAPFAPDYESAARWIDGRIADLHADFTERYGGDLLFVVTSDHGQALGDDEEVGDGPELRKNKHSIHDFNLRVPFLVLPGRPVPPGVRLEGPCSSVDVLPTLLAWMGLPAPADLPGRDLLPNILSGEDLDATRPLYARMSAFRRSNDCVVRDGRKYARFLDPKTQQPLAERVFDLDHDPREVEPLARSLGEHEATLRRAARDQGVSFEARMEDLDPEIEAQLRALGYLR